MYVNIYAFAGCMWTYCIWYILKFRCVLWSGFVCNCCLCVCARCVCLNLNMVWMTCALCDVSAWATCSWSTVASERFASAWLLQSWHLSARLLNCPFLNLIAASSNDNPQTMSNTDSSTVLLGDIEGRHRRQKTEKTSTAQTEDFKILANVQGVPVSCGLITCCILFWLHLFSAVLWSQQKTAEFVADRCAWQCECFVL